MFATLLRRGAFRAVRSAHEAVTIDGISCVRSTRDGGPGGALLVHRTVPAFRELSQVLSVIERHGVEPKPENVRVLAATAAADRVEIAAATASDVLAFAAP